MIFNRKFIATTTTTTTTKTTTTPTTTTKSTITDTSPVPIENSEIINFKKSDICFDFNISTASVEYTGKISMTQSGKNCSFWNSTPDANKYSDEEENFCRSPDHDENGVWLRLWKYYQNRFKSFIKKIFKL